MSVMSTVGSAFSLISRIWTPPDTKTKDKNNTTHPVATRRQACIPKDPIITSSPVPAHRQRKRMLDTGENEGGADDDMPIAKRSKHDAGTCNDVKQDNVSPSPARNTSFLSSFFSPVYSLADSFLSGTPKTPPAHKKVRQSVASLRKRKAATAITAARSLGTSSGPTVDEETEAEYDVEDEDADKVFCPWTFIRDIPPLDPNFKDRVAVLPKKTRRCKPYTLVLDLDETLVHCSTYEVDNYHTKFPVNANGVDYMVYVRIRPHMHEFLERVSKLYEVVLFTASLKVYADKLINLFDPGRQLIKHRLFRTHCVYVGGNYVKDLNILGRPLSKTLIVDNSPQAFAYQLSNGVPIESWFDDHNDKCLLELLPFLERIAGDNVVDVRPHLEEEYRLHEYVGKKFTNT